MLTGTDPAVLPQHKLKIDFHDFVSLPSDFANWIDRLLEPEPSRRFGTAELALAVSEIDNYIDRIDKHIKNS
jgi:eukaryotic-like serine/threonine-protein kinase